MKLNTDELQTIREAEFDETTKCFTITIYCSLEQIDPSGKGMKPTLVENELAEVVYTVPTIYRTVHSTPPGLTPLQEQCCDIWPHNMTTTCVNPRHTF